MFANEEMRKALYMPIDITKNLTSFNSKCRILLPSIAFNCLKR